MVSLRLESADRPVGSHPISVYSRLDRGTSPLGDVGDEFYDNSRSFFSILSANGKSTSCEPHSPNFAATTISTTACIHALHSSCCGRHPKPVVMPREARARNVKITFEGS